MLVITRSRATATVAASAAMAVLVGCTGSAPQAAPDPAGSTAAAVDPRAGERIDAALEALFEASYTDSYRDVRAVLVMVGDEVVLENYYESGPEEPANIFSVTKSVISLLVGIALNEGHLESLDQPLPVLLPAHADTMAPEFRQVTLRHLLTMTSGLPGDEHGWWFVESDDWVSAILSRAPQRPPGEAFAYASANSHLLSAILAEATGRSVLEYANQVLFGPLGIDTDPALEPPLAEEYIEAYEAADFAWPVDPQGNHTGGSFLTLTAPDMLKIGQLVRDSGLWGGKQIVSEDWIDTSTPGQVPNASGTGGAPMYGLHWWADSAEEDTPFRALGAFGQLIEVVPDMDLVVAVSTAAPIDTEVPRYAHTSVVDLVQTVIIPALDSQ